MRFATPTIAKHGDGQIEKSWAGMMLSAQYEDVYRQGLQHMREKKNGEPLYLYGRIMCVSLYDMHIIMDVGGIRDYGNASTRVTMVNE